MKITPLTNFIIFLVIFSLTFDVFNSYMAYKTNKDYFMTYEAHKPLVESLKSGTPFFLTYPILQLFFISLVLILLIFIQKYYYNKMDIFLKALTILSWIPLSVGSFKHIFGGLSWIGLI